MNQTIRIIGGQYRGKKLNFPDIEGLRPTPDRVRETLFNWLMHYIRDARCLDAFSGSGALGFEAFSRGASQITLVELNNSAFRNLQKIATAFNSSKLNIVHQDACLYMQQTHAQFDIVFLDPPFSQLYLLDCIKTLEDSSLLVKNGLLYLETPEEIILNPAKWQQLKLKKSGQVVYGLYQKQI